MVNSAPPKPSPRSGRSVNVENRILQFVGKLEQSLNSEQSLKLLDNYLNSVQKNRHDKNKIRSEFTAMLRQLPNGNELASEFRTLFSESTALLRPSGNVETGKKLARTNLDPNFEYLLRYWVNIIQPDASPKLEGSKFKSTDAYLQYLQNIQKLSKDFISKRTNTSPPKSPEVTEIVSSTKPVLKGKDSTLDPEGIASDREVGHEAPKVSRTSYGNMIQNLGISTNVVSSPLVIDENPKDLEVETPMDVEVDIPLDAEIDLPSDVEFEIPKASEDVEPVIIDNNPVVVEEPKETKEVKTHVSDTPVDTQSSKNSAKQNHIKITEIQATDSQEDLYGTPATDLLRALQQYIKNNKWNITGFGGENAYFFDNKDKSGKPTANVIVPYNVRKQLDAIENFMETVKFNPNKGGDYDPEKEKEALKAVIKAFVEIPDNANKSNSFRARFSRLFTRKESTKDYYGSFANADQMIDLLGLKENQKASALLKEIVKNPNNYKNDNAISTLLEEMNPPERQQMRIH